jgi:hypothetical protein
MLKIIKRGIAVAAAAALPLTLAALPASAAIPTDGVHPDTDTDGAGTADTADGSITVVKSTVDEGGVKYTISVKWNYKYVYQGVKRVSVNPLVVYRSDANVLATGNPEDAGLDLHYDVYNSSGTQIQHKLFDAVDLDANADNQASFNPANPRSNANDPDDPDDPYSYVRVKVGTDADGKGSSPWVIFAQPENLPTKAAS